jgi:large subunit ribosomal protein L11
MSSKGKPATTHVVRLLVPAGKASPSPPVGPALGQRGVKSMDFCKQFNDRTKQYIQNIPMRVILNVKPDRSFTFTVKSPPTSWILMQTAGIEKGSSRPNNTLVGELSLKHIYEIAAIKMKDPGMEDITHEAMCSRILAQANKMGINIVY